MIPARVAVVRSALMTAASFSASLRCGAGCAGVLPLDATVYACPRCGELLEVVHDLAALSARTGSSWRELFESRARLGSSLPSSGVWARKEWVSPQLRDECIVSLGEGASSLLRATRYGRDIALDDLWIKQCGNSHSGSFKDLGMTVLVSVVRQMVADGRDIRPWSAPPPETPPHHSPRTAPPQASAQQFCFHAGKITTAQLRAAGSRRARLCTRN